MRERQEGQEGFVAASARFGTAIVCASLVLATALPAWAGIKDRKAGAGYIPSITNPILNETPYITTEARAFYMWHQVPKSFPGSGVPGAGDIHLFALQLRVALTERLGFIATKDGYALMRFDTLPDDDGFANVTAGFKYALIHRPEDDTLLTIGARYEIPVGSLRTAGIQLQGKGDGMLDVFLTGAVPAGPNAGLQASVGANFAIDQDHDTSFVHASLHGHYHLWRGLYGLLESNVTTTFNTGNRTGLTQEGVDVVNLGSVDSGTVFTFGFGPRYRFTDNFIVGVGYEIPFGGRRDMFGQRVTLDGVLHF